MRQTFLVLSLLTLSVACQKSPPVLTSESDEVIEVASAITQKNWKKVQSESKDADDPLLQLAYAYALFQDNQFQAVLEIKPQPSVLDPYFQYLQLLSAYQTKRFEMLRSTPAHSDLPKRLRSHLQIAIADSYLDENKLKEAREAYLSYFNSKEQYRRAQVLLKLAGVEWELGLKAEALKHYRDLYENFSVEDDEDVILARLLSGNKFQEINTATHLNRVRQLRRSAQFAKAEHLLETLRRALDPKDRAKLEFAEAQVMFSQKQYTRVSGLAREAIQRTVDPELKSQWLELLGWSELRLGRYEDAKRIYKSLLNQKIPAPMREAVLFRLGAAAVDYEDYSEAAIHFEELLRNHSNGRFLESTHWFAAWSIYQKELKEKEVNTKNLERAIQYLERLPKLSNGGAFTAQSLYWRLRIFETLKDKEKQNASTVELETQWKLSFYKALLQPKALASVARREVEINQESPQFAPESFSAYQQSPHWQRLEAFRALHIMDWARMELDIFIHKNRSLNRDEKMVVAQRLRDLGDWPDLVRWTERHLVPSLEKAHEDRAALQLLYPLAHHKFVLRSAEDARVSPFLIWGVMREESRFEVEVRSAAGAEGLMQLMPSLGRRLAQALGEKSHKGFLLDARRNIRLGTYHLRELLDEVRELTSSPELRVVLAIAAYNAGIEPVRKWTQEQDTSRVDTFIENIPYTETRQYVKRVLQTAMIYARLYELPQKTVARSLNQGEL